MDSIPFNQPSIVGNELEYIRDTVKAGHTASDGSYTERVSEILRDEHHCADVLLTTSCTSALELAALLLEIQPGDRIIVPSFTFVSTALAFARQGAEIVFCDIEPNTLGLDPDHLAELIDGSVRAVIPVHYAGIACEIDSVRRIAEQGDCDIVEDNAHGLFGRYRGQPLGTFGRFSTLSFHETKNFICGEGGALVVNHQADVERAHVLLDKGTNRRAFLLGDVDKYSWQDFGSSFGLSDVLAAYLYGQLERRAEVLRRRRVIFERYQTLLSPHRESLGIRLPELPADRVPAYHMFYVLLPNQDVRDRTLLEMKRRGVTATFHYVPLHSSPGGQRFGVQPASCPVTEEISGRLLRLPFFNTLTESDIDRVVEVLVQVLGE